MIDAFLRSLEAVFTWLLEASWQASVLAALVLVLQAVLRGRLNPRWQHALWLLVIVRLVLPVLPESTLSLFQFTPPAPPAIEQSVTEPIFIAASVKPVAMPSLRPPAPAPAPAYPFSLYTLLALVWLTGASGLLLLTWQVNRRFARYVKSTPPLDDPRILALAAAARAELGVRRSLRLIESAQAEGPAIMGLIHPTLILPERVRARFSDDELRFIFLHEFAHLKRGDLVVQWLIALLQILHWFNPVLWYAFRRMRADREPATDALVLSRAGEADKERYGHVLIKLLEHYHRRHSLPTLVGILEDKDQFKRRFSLIAKFTRGAYGWSLLGVVVIAALAVAGLTRSERAAFKRDPRLPEAIDLQPFYTRVFHDPTGADSTYKGYAGHKTIDGLPFDLGGEIVLYGKETADRNKDYPERVSGIRIDRKFDELHLIHAAQWREYYGCPVATIRLHYADGTTADLPIRFDFQVNDWSRLYTEDAEIIADPDTKIIWRGAGSAEGTGRLFKSVLHNPSPEKKVESMDLISTDSGCSYVLVAATVAQREPGREVTPALPLLPPRHFLGHLNVRVVDKKTGAPISGAEIYPAMITGDISLVADNLVTGADGSAVVNYPTGGEKIPAGSGDAGDPKYPREGAKDLRLKVTKAGYANCEIHWQNGWDAGEIPEAITYRLTPDGDTAPDSGPDFTITPSAHPTLLAAVKEGDAVSLQKLIDQGADPAKVDDQGSPLIFAAGSPAVAEILLDHGANPNARDKQNDAAINFFCRKGGQQAAAIVGVLLAHGADPNSPDGELGETPLMEAQDGETVDVLVAHGANVNAKLKDGTRLPAMVSGQKPDYLDALIRHGVPFDPRTDGPTILVHAAWRDNVGLIKAVLDRGVDPNLPGLWAMWHGKPDTMKPLEAAVVAGQFAAAQLLLDHGAKADDVMIDALHNRRKDLIKLFWEHGVRSISELCYDVSQNAPIDDLQKLLDGGMPADPPQDKKFSPLALAAQLGNMEAVKLLVSRGADVNRAPVFNPKFPIYKMSALVMASSEGQDEIVQYLLAHGARPDAGALWQAAENSTPYTDQKPKEHFEKCVRILLDAGALKGATPEEEGYILASALGTRQGPPNATVLKMLLDAGISPEVPMPYIVKNGEKPNTVVGYYRDYYQKRQNDPAYGDQTTALKPLIEMLEAADKGARTHLDSTTKTTARPTAPTGNQIEVSCKVAEVKENVYLANREKVDAAVKKGDMGYLVNLKGVSLLSEPSVSTLPGLKATIEITRAMPFPVNFEKDKEGKFVPTAFETRNCGVTATLTPTEANGRVQVTGTLSLTTFEGFTFNGDSDTRVGSPTFRTTESYVFEEMDNASQLKGVMIPGIQNEPPVRPFIAGMPIQPEQMQETPNRLIVFLSARRVH